MEMDEQFLLKFPSPSSKPLVMYLDLRYSSGWKSNRNRAGQSGSLFIIMKHQLLAPNLLVDIIITESSGHNKVENVPHTLGDTTKLLKSSTDALKPRINMYPDAHFESRPTLHATGASSSIHARLSNGISFDVKYAFIVVTRVLACLLIRLTT